MTPVAKLNLALNRYLPQRSPLTPVDWCTSNLHFNESGNRARFTIEGSEYVADVLNDFGEGTIADEVLVWGSQTRKTGTLMGGVAWCVINDPCAFLWVMPSLTLGQKFANQRWRKMLKASPVTEELIPTGAGRHDFSTLTQLLGSSTINFVGSNSAANLSSNPCRRIICDEVDKFDEGGNREASALNLAEQRTKGQVNAQRWKTSTPTLDTGLIWQDYQKGNQLRYFVPCPHCAREVLFSWSERMTAMPKLGCEAFVTWSPEARGADGEWDLELVRLTAHATCPFCKADIRDEHKPAMIKAGKWKPTNPKASPGYVSRHLPSMYSTLPETSFGALAVKFLQAKRSINGLQGFINGDLAEPFVDQDRVAKRTEHVMDKTEIDGNAGALIMSIDCQALHPRFWWVVRHWHAGGSLAIASGSAEAWEELREVQARYKVTDPGVFVDASEGFEASNIYRKCAEFHTIANGELISWTPCKGFHSGNMWRDRDTGAVTTIRIGTVDPFIGTADAGKLKIPLLEFLGSQLKDLLSRLRESKDTTFKWAVAKDMATEEYWRHMDGELKRYVYNKKTGRTKHEWIKRGKTWPNHLFDCEVIQIAAAITLQLLDDYKPGKPT